MNPFSSNEGDDNGYKKKYLAIESYLAIFSPVIAGVIIDKFNIMYVLSIFPGIMFIGSFMQYIDGFSHATMIFTSKALISFGDSGLFIG